MNIQTVNFQGLFFINVSKPTEFEMKFLKNTYHFNPLNLEDYLHRTQVPKIEKHRNYTLVVLRFPIFAENTPENSNQYDVHLPTFRSQNTKKKRLVSSYVDIFISKEYAIVIHDGTLPQINNIFSLCQQSIHNRSDYMGKGAAFLAYRIVDALVDDCFRVVNELTATIDKIDKELEIKQSQKTLENISTTRRNVVVLHTMIKPILPLFRELEEGKHEDLNGPMQQFWSNALDHLRKIVDRTEDNRELIEGISESNESYIMTQTNLVIKVLTATTVIILPLQVLGGFYGMNVENLPFTKGPYTFFIHIGMILAVVIPLVIIFKLKRWF